MLHNAYLIKGWLLDKDPPTAVLAALDAIIASSSPQDAVAQPCQPTLEKPPTTTLVTATFVHRPVEGVEPPAATASAVDDSAPPTKRKHNWSPERRAAAAERMRLRRADGTIQRNKDKERTPGEASAPLPAEAVGARPKW